MVAWTNSNPPTRVALIGFGNCAAAYLNHLARAKSSTQKVCLVFDIDEDKVAKKIKEAAKVSSLDVRQELSWGEAEDLVIELGPKLDGAFTNPRHTIRPSVEKAQRVSTLLQGKSIQVAVCLLPTGANRAARHYAFEAARARCSFINCMPSKIARDRRLRTVFTSKGLALLGDDIKSTFGATRATEIILKGLSESGFKPVEVRQLNRGGNTDFGNLIHRGWDKIDSKRSTLSSFLDLSVAFGYESTLGDTKIAEISCSFAHDSPICSLSLRLEVKDSPNAAGIIVALIELAAAAGFQSDAHLDACAKKFLKAPS